MSAVTVELSGDDTSLLRSLDRVIAREATHEEQLKRTAAAGDGAGREIASAMDLITRSSDTALKGLLADLRRAGPDGRKLASGLQEQFAAAGKAGYSSIDTVLQRMAALDPAAAATAAAIRQQFGTLDAQANFGMTLDAMKELGGNAAKIVADIQRGLRKTGTDTDGLQRYLAEMRSLGDESARMADEIEKRLAEADAASDFDETIKQLERLGREGKTIADGIRRDMVAADNAAAGDMDAILAKLAAINPAATQSAATIKQELAAAAQFSEGQFEQTLNTLRSMGPVGKQTADELKKHLVEAGQISERSIDDIITTLHAIDPAAADAARAIHTRMENAANQSESAFSRFGKSAFGQIASVVTAYVGIDQAIASVTNYLREQEEILDRVLNRQLSLAKAQQEAAKNLAGLSTVERDELLQKAVPEIAAKTGFSDVAQITNALGAAVSRGANSEQARQAVTQAARLEINTPDNLDETAGGAVALQLQTGLTDIRQAIALIQTTGTQSAIVDPTKLIESLPKAVGSAVATVRNQDVEQASRQAAALFAQITQSGNDVQGTSSATFEIDLTTRLEKFFTGFGDQLVDARSQVDLLDRKIAGGTDTEANRRDRERLVEFVNRGEQLLPQLQGTEAFETLSGRIATLQENPALRQQFVGEGFGEKQFQTFLSDIFNRQSATATNFLASADIIQANAAFFEREAENIASGTPQLALANFQNRSEAAQSAQEVSNIEGATLAAFREQVAKTLEQTRPNNVLDGFTASFVEETGIRSGSFAGGTVAEEAVSGIATLEGRKTAIFNEQPSPARDDKIARLDTQIEAIYTLLETQARFLAPGSLTDATDRISSDREVVQSESIRQFLDDMLRRFQEISRNAERPAVPIVAATPQPTPITSAQAPASTEAPANLLPDQRDTSPANDAPPTVTIVQADSSPSTEPPAIAPAPVTPIVTVQAPEAMLPPSLAPLPPPQPIDASVATQPRRETSDAETPPPPPRSARITTALDDTGTSMANAFGTLQIDSADIEIDTADIVINNATIARLTVAQSAPSTAAPPTQLAARPPNLVPPSTLTSVTTPEQPDDEPPPQPPQVITDPNVYGFRTPELPIQTQQAEDSPTQPPNLVPPSTAESVATTGQPDAEPTQQPPQVITDPNVYGYRTPQEPIQTQQADDAPTQPPIFGSPFSLAAITMPEVFDAESRKDEERPRPPIQTQQAEDSPTQPPNLVPPSTLTSVTTPEQPESEPLPPPPIQTQQAKDAPSAPPEFGPPTRPLSPEEKLEAEFAGQDETAMPEFKLFDKSKTPRAMAAAERARDRESQQEKLSFDRDVKKEQRKDTRDRKRSEFESRRATAKENFDQFGTAALKMDLPPPTQTMQSQQAAAQAAAQPPANTQSFDQLTQLLEQQNQMLGQLVAAAQTTATNTRPKPGDMSAAMRASARLSDHRAANV